MRIITISREFGSGGRELGRRMSDLLGYEYFDREIISAIAKNRGMDEAYVENMLENQSWKGIPLHYRSSISGSAALQRSKTNLLLEERQVIEAIAGAGKDCVIVGRSAGILLRDYSPFRLFVAADLDVRVRRCLERARKDERLSQKEMERKIRGIDKNRAQMHELIAGSAWGERNAYHLTVNTSDWEIKQLAPAVAEFAVRWFERKLE